MLILPETDCFITMASTLELTNLPKTIDSVLTESKETTEIYTTDIKTSPSLVPPVDQSQSSRYQRQTSLPAQQRRHQQQKEFRQHQQQPRQPHHNWDINDSTIPAPEMYDPFDVWPTGHCRRVYRGDIDDARRHISGWAMRNTNNHNALILKKSCLGVLVCSNDCMMDNGRKVHLRPAICDKARRKQIGKSCPNPGCCGKLTLLPCRGHCGYPVTHFWRQVKGSVFFQAKGYHDHPQPDVKSLSEKGRNALAKHIRHNLNPLVLFPSKRRHSSINHDDGPLKKMASKAKEVMCSCPPFECNCKQRGMTQKTVLPNSSPSTNCPPFTTGLQPPGSFLQEPFQGGPVTQINITNTCLPHPNLGVNIPYSSSSFLPPNSRIYHANTIVREDINQFLRYGGSDVPSPQGLSSPHSTVHYHYDDFKSRHSQVLYSEFQPGTNGVMPSEHQIPFQASNNEHAEGNTTISESTQMERTHIQFAHHRETTDLRVSPSSADYVIKPEHSEPNFLMPYNMPHQELQSVENREHNSAHCQQNSASFIPDFNALTFCPSPEHHILHPREYIDTPDNRSDEYKYLQTRENIDTNQREQIQHGQSYQQHQEPNMHQPTFITLTPPDKHNYDLSFYRQNDRSPHAIPTIAENPPCPQTEQVYNYDESTRMSSVTPPHLVDSTATSKSSTITHLGTRSHDVVMPISHTPVESNELSHGPDVSVVNLPCSNTISTPPTHHDLPTAGGQHIMPNETAAVPYYHGHGYTNTSSNVSFNPYYTDVFQPTSTHSQQFQHQQHQHQQRRNSINITLTYN